MNRHTGVWIGYAIRHSAVPALKATHVATVQYSVPVIVALFLGKFPTLRLELASAAILGGVALVILKETTASGQ